MDFKQFIYTPLEAALSCGLPSMPDNISWFVPELRSVPGSGVIGGMDTRTYLPRLDLGELALHRYVLDTLSDNTGHVWIEHQRHPMFIIAARVERLRAEFPNLNRLHEERCANRSTVAIGAGDEKNIADFWRLRASQTIGEYSRLARWLTRLDVVVPADVIAPRWKISHQMHGGLWEDFSRSFRGIEFHRSVADSVSGDTELAHQSNSYILRASIFREFANALFETISVFLGQRPMLHPGALSYLSARFFGLYLRHKRLSSPMLQIHEAPLLAVGPMVAPESPPADFDPAGYLRLNPDVAEVGMDAGEHYIMYGWKELRDWRDAT